MDDLPLEAIRSLLALADNYHLRELVVEENGLRVTIRSEAPLAAPPAAVPPAASAPAAAEPLSGEEFADAEPPDEDEGLHALCSPMTGIFYRSPSPDSPSFVVEDQVIEEGQTVGLIEAMKVFSEIPADVSGRVVRIVAEAGKLLHEGDVLMLVEVEPAANPAHGDA
jgi:acetyl-CoA carboxylase biotin carboxyl carrier protein